MCVENFTGVIMIKNLSKSRGRFSQMICEISSTRCSIVEAQSIDASMRN